MLPPAQKYCPRCEHTRARTDFAKNTSTKDGLQDYCKTCSVAFVMESQARYPEVYRQNQLTRYRRPAYQAKNARYRQHRGWGGKRLRVPEWTALKALYDHRCVYCGRKMQRLTQDHITPVSRGGLTVLCNIVPACQSCNSKKRAGAVLCPIQPALLVG
jgi:HNH endonuclease